MVRTNVPTRKFGGKTFYLFTHKPVNKTAVTNLGKRQRRLGYTIRTVKVKGGYNLYTGKK